MEQNGLLEVQNLTKAFRVPSRRLFEKDRSLLAVNDVSLSICRGETLGVVGESGCGKSTLGRTMIKLIRPTRGRILLEGKDITALSEKEMRPYRRELQIIFQDPYASLNPRMTIGEAIADPLIIQGLYSDRAVRTAYVQALMEECGLDPAMAHRYPHEFSGGQRQRIGIARALGLSPKLIVCDEPVSALDVSIQSQILNLLTRLRAERELTLMFISHDLSVINYISDRVAVPTTFPSSTTFPTGWPLCIWARWWSLRKRRNCLPILRTPIPERFWRRSPRWAGANSIWNAPFWRGPSQAR